MVTGLARSQLRDQAKRVGVREEAWSNRSNLMKKRRGRRETGLSMECVRHLEPNAKKTQNHLTRRSRQRRSAPPRCRMRQAVGDPY